MEQNTPGGGARRDFSTSGLRAATWLRAQRYGAPRATRDVDVSVALDTTQLHAVEQACRAQQAECTTAGSLCTSSTAAYA